MASAHAPARSLYQAHRKRRSFSIGALGHAIGLIGFLALVLLPIAALSLWTIDYTGTVNRIYYNLWQVLQFAVGQALLSSGLSLVFGLMLAWSIAHGPPRLTPLVKLSLLVPLVMPVITICLAWLILMGNQGLGGWLGFGQAYGFSPIIFVHVFLNMALVAWIVLPAWENAPSGYWRNAKILGLNGWQLWRQLEWPLVKPYAIRAVALSFLFCFTSFTPVFLLGGSPRYTTFETAIYAAMRTNFDPSYALILGLVQFVLCGLIILLVLRRIPRNAFRLGLNTSHRSLYVNDSLGMWVIGLGIILICVTPLLILLWRSSDTIIDWLSNNLHHRTQRTLTALLPAIGTSMLMIFCSMFSSLLIGWQLSALSVRLRQQRPRLGESLELVGGAIYAFPALIIGAGWLAIISLVNGWEHEWITYLAFISITTLVGVPIVMRAAVPTYEQIDLEYGKLAAQLGIRGLNRLKHITWPRLKRTLLLAAAYAGILSAGDLGAFIMVSSDTVLTLPVLIQRQMAAYQHGAAALSSLALMLVQALWLALIWRLTR